MFPGPVILADLCGLLIRFRQGPIGIISDIEKAFLQVRLKPVDRDVTRFLWVKDINRPPTPGNLIVYRFTSVCFGVTASPYMLAGTIKHHLTKIGTPVAKQILTNGYVDNVITCVNSTSEAVAYYNEAKQLFNLASMNLREWFSNDQKFMICVDDNDQGNSRRTTVLGMDWDLDSDSLRCRSKTDAETCCGTKRALLQAIAQLFDPCGLLSPVSITGKIMMQDLWKHKIGWDDQFSQEQRIRAQTIVENLKVAVELSVPRHIGFGPGVTVELHCFVDASRAAYAAVTYQRTTLPDGFTKSRLLFSKAKVAPAKKPLTIPKLELSAVDLGAKLLRFLTTELRCPIGALFVWSDSMCAIQWVRGNFRKPVFVRNRVDRVRSVENLVVRYVPTAENPADIPTKGITVDELEKTTLWWHGPRWLTLESREWPTTPEIKESLETTDDTPTSLVVVEKPALPVVLENYSSLDRAINVLAWVRRFVNRARGKTTCGKSQITADERTKALDLLISDCQREFSVKHREDYLAAVQDLNLFMDSNGIIRCDGRLKNSTVPYDTCFPIFVPRKSVLLKLLIKKIHEILGHAGVVHILSELRSRYWIPRARSEIKKILADCIICRRWKGGPYRTPKPPPLPAFRVMEQPSFSSVGLDYAGPLHIRHRDGERSKVWICLFTCCTTRAVHLEVVTDMTANQFLLALRRFIGHRNTPELIVCDNAKQFRLSSKVTQDVLAPVVSEPSIQEFSAKRGISWKFIVEFAPWMGGMYERMVGLTKKSLRCMLQNMLVDLVELQTLCVEVSAILNSRPLTYCEDQLGYKPLTPNHLQSRFGNVLSQSDGKALESDDYNPSPDSKSSLILRWKRLEARLSEFWKVWHKDYLTALSHQHWHPSTRGSAKDAPQVGSVVLVGDSILPRGQWIMGRIEKLCQSGADDQVRAVIIRTAAGKQLRRPLKLVYPLEIADVGEYDDKNTTDPLPTVPLSTASTPNPKPSQSEQRPVRDAAVKARSRMKQLLKDAEADESIL